MSWSVNAFKFNISELDFFSILEDFDSIFLSSFWAKINWAIVSFLELSMSGNVIGMIMSHENSFQLYLSVLDNLIVFADIVLRINDEGFTIGFDII
jgi:hypothetical protein